MSFGGDHYMQTLRRRVGRQNFFSFGDRLANIQQTKWAYLAKLQLGVVSTFFVELANAQLESPS
jgi:hypothetical protein